MNLPLELTELIQEKLWLLPQVFSEYEQPFLQDYFLQKLLAGASPAVIKHFSSSNPMVELDLKTLFERAKYEGVKFILEQRKGGSLTIDADGIKGERLFNTYIKIMSV